MYYAVINDLEPQLEEAFEAGNQAKISDLKSQLQNLLNSLDAELAGTSTANTTGSTASSSTSGVVPQPYASWLLASAFEGYSLLSMVSEQLGEDDTVLQLTEKLQSVAAVAAPASDLHLLISVRLLSRVQQRYGPESEEAGKAVQMCRGVLEMRYGRGLKSETVDKLLVAGSQALDIITV